MPIAFPPQSRGSVFDDITLLYRKPFDVVPAPNMGRPGVRFNAQSLSPGIPLTKARPNVRRLGTMYAAVTNTATINPVNVPVTDGRVFNRVQANLNMSLSGVSRDSTGAALASCQVLVFRTEDKTLVAETTSDASGNWSISLLKGGPFFLVEYKDGGTPVAGTSINTLAPVQV